MFDVRVKLALLGPFFMPIQNKTPRRKINGGPVVREKEQAWRVPAIITLTPPSTDSKY